MLKVIGLTGGIGTGKSTAADYLKKKGFAHIDADEISRSLTADGSSMLPVLNNIFGPKGAFGDGETEILDEKGRLIRKALAGVVFSDKERKARLDEIMFERIISDIDFQIRKIQEKHDENTVGILLDAPLLFEAGLDTRCDKVLVLVADEEVRVERVCSRDGSTRSEVRARINNQMSDNEKIKRSDIVIDNSEGVEELHDNLDIFMDEYFCVS